jgi:hypothetical protein
MALTDAQRARLTRPVLAELERLERDVAHYQAILATGPDDSDTFADPYSSAVRPLGKGAHVRFGGTGHEGTIDAYWEDGRLKIKGNERGGKDAMVISPQSGNVVFIGFRERL